MASLINKPMKKRLQISKTLALLGLVIILANYGGSSIAVPNDQIPIKKLRLFSDIYKQVKLHYVEDVTDTKLLNGAIKGMIKSARLESTTNTQTNKAHYQHFLVTDEDNAGQAGNATTLPLKKLRLISNLYGELAHENDTVNGEELFEGAIHGMLKELDPYSTYLQKRAYNDLKIGTGGKFGGLGIVVGKKDNAVKVIEVLAKTPAERAGLQRKDSIIKINDTWVKDISLGDAVDMMRGEKGTKITLLIERQDLEKPFSVSLKRATVKRESVKHVQLENNIGYVRISNFQIKTSVELKKKLAKLQKESGLDGIILDLRFNPGGILNEAVAVSDVFLQSNQLVVYTQGRQKESKTEYKTKSNSKYTKTPLIVLINGGSASASEIVTGALKDHERALIMGQKTFGKASVQTVLPIDDTSALKLTTARYYTPSGSMIDHIGIPPDIVIEPPKEEELQEKVEAADPEKTEEPDDEVAEWLSFEDRVKKDPQVSLAVSKMNALIGVAKEL